MKDCNWPGCPRQVPFHMWGCSFHWYKLPTFLRDAVWRQYRSTAMGTNGYEVVARVVELWIETTEGVRKLATGDVLSNTLVRINSEFEHQLQRSGL